MIFLANALSILQALRRVRFPDFTGELSKIVAVRHTMIQWVLSHYGIPENEKADKLARKGSE